MKVIISGSGAMGGTFGSMFKLAGHEVLFLDMWQKNIDTINKEGIKFEKVDHEEIIQAQAMRPEEASGTADLLIVFTKSMQLREMLSAVKHLISKDTYVLCLLNGLGHIETLKDFVDEDRILMGVTVLTAGMKGPGHFECSNFGKTEVQNIGAAGKEGAEKIIKAMDEAGLPTGYSEDIRFSIWRKACINGTMNCCCALLDCNMLELGQTPDLRHLLGSIVKEFAAVAEKQGTHLNVEEITDLVCWYTTPEFGGVHHYPSMHQDLIQKHRYTEIDFLNGYVARKAKEYGLKAPFCAVLTLLVHARESVLINSDK